MPTKHTSTIHEIIPFFCPFFGGTLCLRKIIIFAAENHYCIIQMDDYHAENID